MGPKNYSIYLMELPSPRDTAGPGTCFFLPPGTEAQMFLGSDLGRKQVIWGGNFTLFLFNTSVGFQLCNVILSILDFFFLVPISKCFVIFRAKLLQKCLKEGSICIFLNNHTTANQKCNNHIKGSHKSLPFCKRDVWPK